MKANLVWVLLLFLAATFSSANALQQNQPLGPVYDRHMSDCENRWVVLHKELGDESYTYGFVYIDPEAGFTLHLWGRFTVDANGKYQVAANPFPRDKFSVKIRLDGNGVAALLPRDAQEQLGLPEKPDWLAAYEDKSDPTRHKVLWGIHYNAIGDSKRALEYLEPAYKENPSAPRLVFELAYAYNALDRSQDAIRVSKDDFAKNPKDELLCREIAFAHLRLKSYKEAAEQYQACIRLCGDAEALMAEKSELAMNLSGVFDKLGEPSKRDEWREKAKTWAPKGSPIYRYFHPGEE